VLSDKEDIKKPYKPIKIDCKPSGDSSRNNMSLLDQLKARLSSKESQRNGNKDQKTFSSTAGPNKVQLNFMTAQLIVTAEQFNH